MFSQLRQVKLKEIKSKQNTITTTQHPPASFSSLVPLRSLRRLPQKPAPMKQLRNILKPSNRYQPNPHVPHTNPPPNISRYNRNTSSKLIITMPSQSSATPTNHDKMRQCLSSKSTVRNSKVDSLGSRQVSPVKTINTVNSFACEETVNREIEVDRDCPYKVRACVLRESEVHTDHQYMLRQQLMNQNVRAILLDWMMELSQEYGLLRVTYQQAVCIVDRFLSKTKETIKRGRVQLIGATALLISSKLDELFPRNIQDFSLATNQSYSKQDISDMEQEIIQTLKWKMRSPTYCFWVDTLVDRWTAHRRALHIAQLDFNEQQCQFQEKLQRVLHSVLDAAQLDIQSLKFKRHEAVISLLLLALGYLHGELDIEEIELSISFSAKYMVNSGTMLVVKYCDFIRKLFGINLQRELLECIQFIASYFFAVKKSNYTTTDRKPTHKDINSHQQYTGKGLDCLARRKYLSQQCTHHMRHPEP